MVASCCSILSPAVVTEDKKKRRDRGQHVQRRLHGIWQKRARQMPSKGGTGARNRQLARGRGACARRGIV